MTNDNSSILSFLADKGRFTNGTEDIATEALGYVLSKSVACREALREIVRTGGADVGPLASVKTQDTGDKGERPDLVGFDSRGIQRLLIEAKFWAGLTENQPNTYLERLPADGSPAVLLFVAPEARLETLWPEVLRRAEEKFNLVDTGVTGIKSAIVDGSERRLMLTSWRALLGSMSSRASVDGDSSAERDVLQLNALCEREDTEAFLPLRSEELGPGFPRRMSHLITLVWQATQDNRLSRFITWSGPLTSSTTGHGRFHWFQDVSVWFGLEYAFWAKYRETPVWLILRDTTTFTDPAFKESAVIGEIRRRAQTLLQRDPPEAIDTGGDLLVPIFLPTGVERGTVLNAMVERILEIARLISPP